VRNPINPPVIPAMKLISAAIMVRSGCCVSSSVNIPISPIIAMVPSMLIMWFCVVVFMFSPLLYSSLFHSFIPFLGGCLFFGVVWA
jgi:hypothetical protein